jgi:GNAT superfamily N-acetyltransferase
VATILVRIAVAADAPDIATLAGELGYPVEPRQMQARLSALLKSPLHFIAVAEQDDARISGWVHVEHRCILEYGERAEIVGLVVAGAARRTGVATSLIGSGERWAADRGLRDIAVRSNVVRTASHPFYEALGYVRQKTQHSYAKILCARPADA